MKWLIPYITVIFLFGCVPIGDNLLVIKGNIEDFNSTENHSCLLTLYNGEDSTVIYQIDVTQDIDIDYTIEPKKRRYKLSIDCTNDVQTTIYDSGIIYLGDKPKDVIELGSLRITK